ncbi:cupin domain-containing protein [Curvivirga sp.]|uniref:cupin domain-containing protein n=1 Tax=Curvivirga sp. TaxID=2856848 RepID=UPI003B59AB45
MSEENSPPLKLSQDDLNYHQGSGYPAPYDEICRDRQKAKIGDIFGLNQFGVNQTILPPGQASSQRHWHTDEDELIYIIAGTATLITDHGETTLTAGDYAGFKAGNPDGHQLINKSDDNVIVLEIGGRSQADEGHYPDIDLLIDEPRYEGKLARFKHKDGSYYED